MSNASRRTSKALHRLYSFLRVIPPLRAGSHHRLRVSLVPVLAVLALAALAAVPVAGRLWVATAPAVSASDDPLEAVAVYGPRTFELARGGTQEHVEVFAVAAVAGTRYRLEVVNGRTDGSGRVSAASLTLNGAALLSERDFDAGVAERSLEVVVQAENVLEVRLTGAEGDRLTVTVWRASDPTFPVWEAGDVVRESGAPVWREWTFPVPSDAAPPFRLHVRNGLADGSARATSARVVLDGVEVLSPADLDPKSPGLVRVVDLTPGTESVIAVRVEGQPGSRLSLRLTATDVVPPVLTGIEPAEGFITNGLEVEVTGGIEDRTPVRLRPISSGSPNSTTPGSRYG